MRNVSGRYKKIDCAKEDRNFKFIIKPVNFFYKNYCHGCGDQCNGKCSDNCQGRCNGNY